MAKVRNIQVVISRFSLATSGAALHAKRLPKEASQAAQQLETQSAAVLAAHLAQKAAEKASKDATQKLTAAIKAGRVACSSVISFAEGVFGVRAAELDQFRAKAIRKPKTDATTRAKTRKGKAATAPSAAAPSDTTAPASK